MHAREDALECLVLLGSTEALGAYHKLLWSTCYRRKPLPDDEEQMARILRVSRRRWRKVIRPELAEYFDLSDGVWINRHFSEEIAKRCEQDARGQRLAARFVYLIARVLPDGSLAAPVKVGVTSDPDARIGQIRTSCPHPVAYVQTWDVNELPREGGALAVERFFIESQAERRIGGEWFSLEPADACRIIERHLAGASETPTR